MTKYIFHGGGTAGESGSNDSFFHEISRDVKEGGSILLVYFASRSDDSSEKAEQDMHKLKNAAEGKQLRFVVATHEAFLSQIAEADAVYLRGGSTEKLLAALSVYPNLKEHFAGKTIAGSSAGAYVLSTLYSSHYEDAVAHGLGIVPVKVVTHYQSEKMPPKMGSVEALKKVSADLPLIILKEGEWEVVIM